MNYPRPNKAKNAVRYFIKKYLVDRGDSFENFSKKYNLHQRIIEAARDGKMSLQLLRAMAKFTNRSETYWYSMQYNYRFKEFEIKLDKRTECLPALNGSPDLGRIMPPEQILSAYFKMNGIVIKDAVKVLNKGKSGRARILRRGNLPGMSIVAIKLGSVLDWSARFWLQIQVFYLLFERITSAKIFSEERTEEIVKRITMRFSAYGCEFQRTKNQEAPTVRLKSFFNQMQPKFTLEDWAKLFLMKKKSIKNAIDIPGHVSMDAILKVSQIFEQDPIKWLDEAIAYHYFSSLEGSRIKKTEMNRIVKGFSRLTTKVQERSILAHLKYYTKMRSSNLLTLHEHIGTGVHEFRRLDRNGAFQDFDLCFKIGDALSMDPYYWAKLRLDKNLKAIANSSFNIMQYL